MTLGWTTIDVLVNQPPLSGNFDAQIVQNSENKPFVVAQLDAPYWDDILLDQPFTYQWFFETQRGDSPFLAERYTKRALDSVYMPRGFSNNIRNLGVQVTDGRGANYYRRKPMMNTATSFTSALCSDGMDEFCQDQLITE